MESGPFVDPAGAQLRHQARMARLQQMVAPAAPAAPPEQHMDIARLATGTLGGMLATSALMRMIPHPAAQATGAALPLLARAMPHIASAVGGIAGFAGAPAIVDSVAPGLHDTVNKNLGPVGGAVALGVPLAMLAMRRGQAPKIPGSAVPPGAAAAAMPHGPVPVVPSNPSAMGMIHAPQRINPVPISTGLVPTHHPQPSSPVHTQAIRGHLPGPAEHVAEVSPVVSQAIRGHLAAPVQFPTIRNPIEGFAAKNVHMAPPPTPSEAAIRGHLPQPSLESRFGVPAEYSAAHSLDPRMMSPGQLAPIALQANSHAMQQVAAMADANLASRSPNQLFNFGLKKKVAVSASDLTPTPVPVVAPEIVPVSERMNQMRLSRRSPQEPMIRMREIQSALREHGPELAADRFNDLARSQRKAPLTHDERRYLEVAAEKLGQTPMEHSRVRSTTVKPLEPAAPRGLINDEELSPVAQAFQGHRQSVFETLARGAERQLMGESDPKRRLKIAKSMMIGEPKEVKAALREHLKTVAPDVHEQLAAKAAKPVAPEVPNVAADLAADQLQEQLSPSPSAMASVPPVAASHLVEPNKMVADPAEHVLKTMEQFRDHDKGALVTSKELREASGLDKPTFDKAIVDLAGQGKVMPHKHDFATSLSPDELSHLVDTSIGDAKRAEMHANDGRYWVGVAKRRGEPVAEVINPLEVKGASNAISPGQITSSGVAEHPNGIYETTVNTHDGPKKMFAIPSRPGTRGFGDELLPTREAAEARIAQKRNLEQQHSELRAKQTAKEAEEAAAKAAREHIDEFGADASPMARANIVKALTKEYSFDGKPMSMRDKIRELVANGELPSTHEVPKIQPMTRAQFNRADGRQQEAHEKKMREAGTKTVYKVGGYEVGKTAHDYANHLIARKGQSNAVGQIREQGVSGGEHPNGVAGGQAATPGSGDRPVGGGEVQTQVENRPAVQEAVAEDPRIAEILAAARRPQPDIREVMKLKGSDGNWYSANGFPRGVTATGEKKSVGFVYADKNGVTYGSPAATREELITRHNEAQDKAAQDLRSHLTTEDKIASQHDYWMQEQAKAGRLSAPVPSEQKSAPPAAAPVRKPFEKAELSVKDAVDRGLISQEKDGRWYVGSGDKPHKSGPEAVQAYLEGSKQVQRDIDAKAIQKFQQAKLRAVRDGDNVTVEYPDGKSESMTMREYRRKVFDIEDKYGSEVALVSKSDLPAPVEPPAAAPARLENVPAYERETPSATQNPIQRAERTERLEQVNNRYREIEKSYSEAYQKLSNTPRKHTKIRRQLEVNVDRLKADFDRVRSEQRELNDARNFELIEDQLQAPKSREHFLKSMSELHDLKRRELNDLMVDRHRRRELGIHDSNDLAKKIDFHQQESDKHTLGLIDEIKSKVPTDKLNKDEIQSVAEDVFRDFSHRTDLERAIPQAVERRLGHRTQYGQSDIDKLPHLDDAAKAKFKGELQQASERGPDWFQKSQEIIANAKSESDKGVIAAREQARLAAEEKARMAEIAAANSFKEGRASNREKLSEPRYFESVEERAKALKGKPEKITGAGSVAAQREGLVERELIGPDWKVEKSLVKNAKGDLESRHDLTHLSSGVTMEVPNPKEARKMVVMLGDQGVSLPSSKEAADSELRKKVSRITSAWNNEQLHGLTPEEHAAAMSKVASAPHDLKADIVLGADDLGYGHENGTHIKAAKINPKLKMLADEVPEFAYNPVFTVNSEKRLVFRDGAKFEFDPEAFNIHASELTPGQTVGINLADLGIKKATPHEVVAGMLKQGGWSNVKVAKSGDIVASAKPGAAPTTFSGKGESWTASGGDAKAGQGLLDEIRWKQPGQDAPAKTHAGVRMAEPTTYADFGELEQQRQIAESQAKREAKVAKPAAKAKPTKPAKIEKLSPKAEVEPEPAVKIEKLSAKATPAKEPKKSANIERLEPKGDAGPIMNPYGDTPTGKAYVSAKKSHPGAIVLQPKGDFYEIFGRDAEQAAKAIGLTVTTLDKNSKNPIPMAGFPKKLLEGHLKKLMDAGHKVAISEAK